MPRRRPTPLLPVVRVVRWARKPGASLLVDWPLDRDRFLEETGRVYVAAGVYKDEWVDRKAKTIEVSRLVRRGAPRRIEVPARRELTYKPTGKAVDGGSGTGPFGPEAKPRRDVEVEYRTEAQARLAAEKIKALGIRGLRIRLVVVREEKL